MGIETICCGGYGGSAEVHIQIRNIFPGLGGVITTEKDFVAACRIPRGTDLAKINNPDANITLESLENKQTLSALGVYFRHSLIKKLDDFFFRSERYRFSHVPRPLGSDVDGIYYYEWVFGDEGYYPQFYDDDYEKWFPVKVDEWDEASGCFYHAGIGFFDDTVDTDGYYIKNIVMLEPRVVDTEEQLTKLWKRIDFGSESLHIDFEKLSKYLHDYKSDLQKYLKEERFEMMELMLNFLMTSSSPSKFEKIDRLSELVFDYRKSTTSHMSKLHLCHIDELERCKTRKINYRIGRNIKDLAFSKRINANSEYSLDLEIRSGFRSIDGIIYTLQEFPVAKMNWLHGNTFYSGFDQFARHYIVKKLEDAFISAGEYSYPHIPRPLGSEANTYYTEWVYGFPKCPKSLIYRDRESSKTEGLYNWYEFYNLFYEAGIDMRSRMRYTQSKMYADVYHSRQIIVRQPLSDDNPKYISRLWQRVGFDEYTTPIDFEILGRYLEERAEFLRSNLTKGRYETMIIMLKYLKGDMTKEEFDWLKINLHDYRISTLRHLNYSGFGLPPEGFVDLSVDSGFAM